MTKRARAGNVPKGDRRLWDKRYRDSHAEEIADKNRVKKISEALAHMDKESVSLVWDDMLEEARQSPSMKKPQIVTRALILLASKCANRPPPAAVQPASTSALGTTPTSAGNQHMMAAMTAMTTQMMTGMRATGIATGMPVPAIMATGMPFTGMAGVPPMMMQPGGIFPGAAAYTTNAVSTSWPLMASLQAAFTTASPAKMDAASDEKTDGADDKETSVDAPSSTKFVPISAAKSPPGTQSMVPSAPSPTSVIADLPIGGDGSPSNKRAEGDEVGDGVSVDVRIGSDESDDGVDGVDGRKMPEHEDDLSAVDEDVDVDNDEEEESANATSKVRPEFDLPHVQSIGDGIFDGKIAQVDVNGVGKDRVTAKLTFFPPGSSPRDYMHQYPEAMDALANGKATLKDHFDVDKKEIGGTEKVHSLDLEVSSDLYHTLVLCKPDRKCTCLSFVMFQRIEGSKDWWVPWLATNKDKQYMKRGYSRYLLETVKHLARGFGAQNIYLEVGTPSKMPDYTVDESDDDKDTEASKWARAGAFYSHLGFISAGDDVPGKVLSLCKEVRNGTHEVLKWDLTAT